VAEALPFCRPKAGQENGTELGIFRQRAVHVNLRVDTRHTADRRGTAGCKQASHSSGSFSARQRTFTAVVVRPSTVTWPLAS